MLGTKKVVTLRLQVAAVPGALRGRTTSIPRTGMAIQVAVGAAVGVVVAKTDRPLTAPLTKLFAFQLAPLPHGPDLSMATERVECCPNQAVAGHVV